MCVPDDCSVKTGNRSIVTGAHVQLIIFDIEICLLLTAATETDKLLH
jgi:hypothetical protein